jgi:hypothetical protein
MSATVECHRCRLHGLHGRVVMIGGDISKVETDGRGRLQVDDEFKHVVPA